MVPNLLVAFLLFAIFHFGLIEASPAAMNALSQSKILTMSAPGTSKIGPLTSSVSMPNPTKRGNSLVNFGINHELLHQSTLRMDHIAPINAVRKTSGLNLLSYEDEPDENSINSIYEKLRSMLGHEEQDHLQTIFFTKLGIMVGIGRNRWQRKQKEDWYKNMSNSVVTVALAESLAEYSSLISKKANAKLETLLEPLIEKNANLVEAFNIAKNKLEKKKERSAKRQQKMAKKKATLGKIETLPNEEIFAKSKETLAKEKKKETVNIFMAEYGLKRQEQKDKFMEIYNSTNIKMPVNAKLRKTLEEYQKYEENLAIENFMAENELNTPEQKKEFMESFRHLKKNNPNDMPTALKLLYTYEYYQQHKKNPSISATSKLGEKLTLEEEQNNWLYRTVTKRFRRYEEHQIHEIIEMMLVQAGIVGQDGKWHYMLLPPPILRTALAYSLVAFLYNQGKRNVENYLDEEIKKNAEFMQEIEDGKLAMDVTMEEKEKEENKLIKKEENKLIIDNFMTENGVHSEEQQEKFMQIYENLNSREKMANDMPLIVKLHDAHGEYLKDEEYLALNKFMAENGLKAEEQQEKFNETYQHMVDEHKFHDNLKMDVRLYRTLKEYKRKYPLHLLRYELPNKIFGKKNKQEED